MTTVVTIKHTNGPTREMNVSFGDKVTGYQRCFDKSLREKSDPFAEPEGQTKVRLLGAALIEAIEEVIPPSERSEAARVANIAKTDIEKGCMLGVKALSEHGVKT